MSTGIAPLPVEQLRWRCDPAKLGFDTTDDVPPLESLVGQERSLEAIGLGLSISATGYNIFVAGPTGTGRSIAVRTEIQRIVPGKSAPPDWVYLHNFQDPYQPLAVSLTTGRGPELAHDLDQLIAACRREIPRVFESEQYDHRRLEIVQSIQAQREARFRELVNYGEQLGFVVQFTPTGILTIPAVSPGQPMSPDAFSLLPDEKKAEYETRGKAIQRRVDETMLSIRHLEREGNEQLEALERQSALFAVGHLLQALKDKWAMAPAIVQQLDAIQADLVEHLDEYRPHDGRDVPPSVSGTTPSYQRYGANVLVTHDPTSGPPKASSSPRPTFGTRWSSRRSWRPSRRDSFTSGPCIRSMKESRS